MGKWEEELKYLEAIKDADIELVGGVESPNNTCIGLPIKDALGIAEMNGLGSIKSSIDQIDKEWDVCIDFTNPEATISHITDVIKKEKAVVIGTTGFSKEQEKELLKLASLIPSVISPNMSIGVNVLFNVLKYITQVLGTDYNIELYEIHHKFKKDAPSGTAKKMAEIIAKAAGFNNNHPFVYGRKGLTGQRPNDIIGIHSLRCGDVVGEHTVIYAGIGERIEITHKAHSRDTFAAGTLRAVKFVYNKPPGIYSMAQVLGIE